VEEELRALVEDKWDQDAQVQEHISQALTLAQRISSGPAVALLLYCASLVLDAALLVRNRFPALPCPPPKAEHVRVSARRRGNAHRVLARPKARKGFSQEAAKRRQPQGE
jgi:hypothetical protein